MLEYVTNKLTGRINADEFLLEMVDSGTATVPARELRNLLINYRKSLAVIKALEEKNEMLMLRNVSLKQEVTELKTKEVLEVVGIDLIV